MKFIRLLTTQCSPFNHQPIDNSNTGDENCSPDPLMRLGRSSPQCSHRTPLSNLTSAQLNRSHILNQETIVMDLHGRN